ncbi:MAG: MobC family plasmid mobilization relaxosome protein [Alphaproteobacteria bacterium]|nr:MobC family plasmid mobilization relaxosome protein [Alphaproteobacteria bacterium]
MAKIGRPRRGEQERRSDHLNVRLTIVERAALDAEARRLGLPVSSYARRLIGKRRSVETGRVPMVSHAAITALNRVGNNLNQLARHANAKGDLTPIARNLAQALSRLETAIDTLLERSS